MLLLLKIALYVIMVFAFLLVCGYGFTRWQSAKLEQRYPNIGELTDIGGLRINSYHWPRPVGADLPPLVFIHGASGNLRDPMGAFFEPLKTRAEMLFVDRPGHGYSDRGGDANLTPDGQADAIARLMTAKGIVEAIIIGHSVGGATTATFGLRHADMTRGLLFLAPATHPWPGGIDWYYDIANRPVIGPIFCSTITLPAGLLQLDGGVKHVFQPNPVPANYSDNAAIPLVLRPTEFCDNARDVANLEAYVRKIQPRYREITAPTIIITGDSDDIVYEELHSRGLKRDIPGSELYWVRNLGHKPDYVATDLAIAAIEKLGGMPRDLNRMVRVVEKRIASTL
ncbi:MAG: lactone-specific esterase protein [Rhizobium sp.]|nr:lactone-specific esterase protein [Rhizobium sp.]